MKARKTNLSRLLALLLAFVIVSSYSVTTISAAESDSIPSAVMTTNGVGVTFSNLDKLEVNEFIEFDVFDTRGRPAKVGVQRMSSNSRAGVEWKVWFTGVAINCHFYMMVNNNQVTSVYDNWILIIGGTYDDAILTHTSSYGKLSFKMTAYAGILSASCWLKGAVTGSNNEVTISYQM